MTLPPSAPTLADLDLLLSVARLGSVRKAAHAHSISQQAASARIRLVERRLGLRLLQRSPSGSRLTPTGAAVARWAGVVIDAASEMLAGAAALRGDEHCLLRISASLTIAEYLIPYWLVGLRSRHPQISVALTATNSHDVVEHVRSGAADLGFVEDPDQHSNLAERAVADDELAVVVAPGHPWARLTAPLTRAHLATEPLVLRERGSGTRETLRRVLGHLHEEAPHLELSSTTAIKEAVAAGAGAAVLSNLTVEHEIRAGELVRVPVQGVTLTRTLRAVWQRHLTAAYPVTALLEIATEFKAGPRRVPSRGLGAQVPLAPAVRAAHPPESEPAPPTSAGVATRAASPPARASLPPRGVKPADKDQRALRRHFGPAMGLLDG